MKIFSFARPLYLSLVRLSLVHSDDTLLHGKERSDYIFLLLLLHYNFLAFAHAHWGTIVIYNREKGSSIQLFMHACYTIDVKNKFFNLLLLKSNLIYFSLCSIKTWWWYNYDTYLMISCLWPFKDKSFHILLSTNFYRFRKNWKFVDMREIRCTLYCRPHSLCKTVHRKLKASVAIRNFTW